MSTAVGNIVLSFHDNRFVLEESWIVKVAVDDNWPIYLAIRNIVENIRNLWRVDDVL